MCHRGPAYHAGMFTKQLAASFIILLCAVPEALHAQRVSDDKDLIELDLTKWDCRDQASGDAKTQDGVERNIGKNRGPIDLSRLAVPNYDTAGFLKLFSAFEAQAKFKRRQDLSYAQKIQLTALERQLVSFTGYLVLSYPGGPETTNCKSVDIHDWHLEVFEKPLDHPPGIGDPTPIICEITPRLQSAFFKAGIRLQELAAFMRRPDQTYEPNQHPARKVRFTGYALWDDDHNGTADIGLRIAERGKNGFHHPWRSTAWEIHPVLKIEVLDGPTPVPGTAPTSATGVEPAAALAPATVPAPAVAPITAPATPPPPQAATLLVPVKVKIPYGETVIPRGTRVDVISRNAQTITIRHLGQDIVVSITSTDLK